MFKEIEKTEEYKIFKSSYNLESTLKQIANNTYIFVSRLTGELYRVRYPEVQYAPRRDVMFRVKKWYDVNEVKHDVDFYIKAFSFLNETYSKPESIKYRIKRGDIYIDEELRFKKNISKLNEERIRRLIKNFDEDSKIRLIGTGDTFFLFDKVRVVDKKKKTEKIEVVYKKEYLRKYYLEGVVLNAELFDKVTSRTNLHMIDYINVNIEWLYSGERMSERRRRSEIKSVMEFVDRGLVKNKKEVLDAYEDYKKGIIEKIKSDFSLYDVYKEYDFVKDCKELLDIEKMSVLNIF